jgi:hypothetical protein
MKNSKLIAAALAGLALCGGDVGAANAVTVTVTATVQPAFNVAIPNAASGRTGEHAAAVALLNDNNTPKAPQPVEIDLSGVNVANYHITITSANHDTDNTCRMKNGTSNDHINYKVVGQATSGTQIAALEDMKHSIPYGPISKVGGLTLCFSTSAEDVAGKPAGAYTDTLTVTFSAN